MKVVLASGVKDLMKRVVSGGPMMVKLLGDRRGEGELLLRAASPNRQAARTMRRTVATGQIQAVRDAPYRLALLIQSQHFFIFRRSRLAVLKRASAGSGLGGSEIRQSGAAARATCLSSERSCS